MTEGPSWLARGTTCTHPTDRAAAPGRGNGIPLTGCEAPAEAGVSTPSLADGRASCCRLSVSHRAAGIALRFVC